MKKSLLYFTFSLLTHAIFSQVTNLSIAINEDSISTASLESEGFDSTIINKLTTEIQNSVYPNIHSLLIARNNKLVYENYWRGVSYIGNPPPVVHNTKDNLHDLRSVSKSFVSACMGIAIAQGKIKGVDQRIMEFFPEYRDQDSGLKSSITIKHLLTMTAGLEWNENIPYTDPENSEIKMDVSPDPIGYVLSRPMQFPPGTVWSYSGGATQLLGSIIERATGKKLDEFANEYLFKPLGIKKFQWRKFGHIDLCGAAWGLRLRPRDVLKFGMLYLDKGMWRGKQVIPAKWVEESVQSYISLDNSNGPAGYGYQFWTWKGGSADETITIAMAIGNGDQNIFLDLTHNLLIVSTAGNYDKNDIEKDVNALISDYIYPALRRK